MKLPIPLFALGAVILLASTLVLGSLFVEWTFRRIGWGKGFLLVLAGVFFLLAAVCFTGSVWSIQRERLGAIQEKVEETKGPK